MTARLASPVLPGNGRAGGGIDVLARVPGRDAALFLDVDGTLLDIAPTPESVVVPPGLGALLEEISLLLGGALALVSGRSLSQLDALFAPCRFAAGGQHGAELRQFGGSSGSSLDDPLLDPIRTRAAALAAEHEGVRVEDKGSSIAVHYRQGPAAEQPVRAALTEALAGQAGLEMLPSKMAFDIKRRGVTKGTAVEQLMAAPPFAGRTPIFVGDDVTDRFGMMATQAIGGFAIQVWDPPPHSTGVVEDFRLQSPAAVRSWLQSFAREIAANTSLPRSMQR